MKLVLLKDVKNMGRAGTAVDVADGHAINFLIPRKLAILATTAALKQAEAITAQHVEMKNVQAKLIAERLATLSEGSVTILKKVNEKGHLYDAVGAMEIAQATELPLDAIALEKPIKEVGTYDVPVSFGGNFGTVSITVAGE
jgi:large subunit ribosomal protein L9